MVGQGRPFTGFPALSVSKLFKGEFIMIYIQALFDIVFCSFTGFLFEGIFFYVALFSLVVSAFFLLQFIILSMKGVC
jgi:hypothetical protein